jgi:hypothetical protein
MSEYLRVGHVESGAGGPLALKHDLHRRATGALRDFTSDRLRLNGYPGALSIMRENQRFVQRCSTGRKERTAGYRATDHLADRRRHNAFVLAPPLGYNPGHGW